MRPLHDDLLSVTFDQETAEIRLLIVTHPSTTTRCNYKRCDISVYLFIYLTHRT